MNEPQGNGSPADPQGNGSPADPQGNGDSAFTEKVAQIAAQVVNQAISARLKTYEKAFDSKLAASSDTILKKLDEMREASAAKPPKKSKEAAGGDDPEEASPAFKSMQRKVQELEAEGQKMKAERDAERAKARGISLRQKLAEELGKNGVSEPAKIRHAMALLVSDEGRVHYAEDSDDLVFRDIDGTELDLPTGLKSWVKSDDGKHFLPPSGARGSGHTPGQGTRNPNGQPNSNEPSMADLGLAIMREYSGVPVG
jgi:ribosomal protein S20